MSVRRYILLLLFAFKASVSFGQVFYDVEDNILKAYLKANFDSVWHTPTDRLLAGESTLVDVERIDLPNYGLTNVEPLAYFQKLDTLILTGNNLVAFDSIHRLFSVEYFDLSYNQITSFPDVFESHQLAYLNLDENLITSIPTAMDSLKDKLIYLNLRRNLLESIPENMFDEFVKLEEVDLSRNKLTFEDLVPLANTPDFSSVFTVFPQQWVPGIEGSYSANVGDDLLISADLDSSLSDMITYYLFKDGAPLDTFDTPDFLFPNTTLSDTGIYHIEYYINHPDLLGGLRTRDFNVYIDDCITVDSVYLTDSVMSNCNETKAVFAFLNSSVSDPSLIIRKVGVGQESGYLFGDTVLLPDGDYEVAVVSLSDLSCKTSFEYQFELQTEACVVPPCVTYDAFNYNILDTVDCEFFVNIGFDNLKPSSATVELVGVFDHDTLVVSNNSTVVLSSDNFILQPTAIGECVETVPELLEPLNWECEEELVDSKWKDMVLTPNGDGVQDEMIFTENGEVEVFNYLGVKVADFSIPSIWQGVGVNDEELPSGYYLMLKNKTSKKFITIQN